MSDAAYAHYIAVTTAYIERLDATGRYRAVAWSLRLAQEGTPRQLTRTHVAERDADGEPIGRTLCGRELPDVWDIDGMRWQSWGYGICETCERRFNAFEEAR